MPFAARLRAPRVVPFVPYVLYYRRASACAFMRRACVGRRQTVQLLPTFYALSRRRATELFFLGAAMVFLVFSEVLEMSSEVAGPGPTHGRSNLAGLTWDLLLVPSRSMPDACYPLVCLLCVWGGGSSRGAVLAAFAPSWRCPQSSLFLYNFYKIQLSTGGKGATLLVVGEGPDVRLSRSALHR